MFNLSILRTREQEDVMARTHGKPSTYNNGKCRCEACQDAIAKYRAERRAQGKDLTSAVAGAGATTKGS